MARLETGHPGPKPADVPLRIYSNPICPYAQRARLAAEAKNIPYEVIDIHLKKKPQWFLTEISAVGKVPVIEHDGHIIPESLVIFNYLDDVCGEKKLWPTDPYTRAQASLILDAFGNKFTSNFYKYFNNKDDIDETTNAAITTFLKSLEKSIAEHGGSFVLGSEVSSVDLLIWPWFERLMVFKDIMPDVGKLFTQEKFPVLSVWISTMQEVEAVKKTALPSEAHLTFFNSLSSGNPQYGGTVIYTS